MPHPFIVHTAFDVLALLLAMAGGWLTYKLYFQEPLAETAARVGTGYFFSLAFGSIAGAYLFGTLNLYLSGIPEVGRSILGAICGAIFMVELYKAKNGIHGSTGYIYVVPFCICVVVGRLGCLFSGVDDFTHGTPTSLPWGWDYGDGLSRHPVQLYESGAMLAFLCFTLVMLKRSRRIVVNYGFYLCAGFYAAQRFVWEFFKPYGDVIGPLNAFQCLCVLLLLYGILMIFRTVHDSRSPQTIPL